MTLRHLEYTDVPVSVSPDTVLTFPAQFDRAFYRERTDRNIGWLLPEEQEMLRHRVVGIAGCGGMGGLLASVFTRLGIGEVRIADCEVFDVSNINRQYAAMHETVGKSKALETAREVRRICTDGKLVVFPQGVDNESVDDFLSGCDIVCDEIEFWAIGARLLLHSKAECRRIPLVTCSTVGFGTRLFFFTHEGMNMEAMLDLSLEEAAMLQRRIQTLEATKTEVQHVMMRMLEALIPELPEYGVPGGPHQSRHTSVKRLLEEGRAPIIATNPPMASGFAADHTLLALLRTHGIRRALASVPETPGYLYFDAALMQARCVNRKEVSHVSL